MVPSIWKRLALGAGVACAAVVWQARIAEALEPSEVQDVVTALQNLGTVVNGLAGVSGLGEPIPFTDVDPSEVLNLDSLLSDALSGLGAPSSLSELAAALDALDDPSLGGTGIAVQFNNVIADDAAGTLSFEFAATRTIGTPLKFADGDVNLDGSSVELLFEVTAPFAFGYDGGASSANEKVFLTNEPTIAVTASANVPSLTAFESLLGFTSVQVGGSLAINVAINAAFHDPDVSGRLTLDEWSSTSLEDLVTVAFANGSGDDVNGNLTLDAQIVPGAPDATVVWVDADLTNGLDSPDVTLNSLDDFTNINPSAVFSGLASTTTALLSAQQTGDLPLPFMKSGLSEVVRFADPLVKFVHELGDAAIVCGPNNTTPPTGNVFGLDEGDTVYCQGYTLNPVDHVDWKIGGVSSNTDLTTVGPNPSTTAALVLGTGGIDSITLDYRFAGDPADRIARPLFLTADELTEKLTSIAGLDTVTAAYSAEQRVLTYRLQHTIPSIAKAIETDFGDQLKAQTGLFGLNDTGSDQIMVEASNIAVDVTIGIILVEDPADIKPGGTNSDRFYLQVNPAGNEFQADVGVVAGSNFGLEGRLAFLRVAAEGVTTAGNPDGAIFALTKSDDAPDVPSLMLNINAPGINSPSLPQSIPDAILVSDLISGGLGGKITAQCELGLSSGLGVSASVGSGTLASGTVAVSWPDVFQDGGCIPDLAGISITPSADFTSDLASFDIDPNNPQQMLSIILDAIAGFAQGIDSLPALGDLDVRVPIVGVSPRELLDKLEEINTAIHEARMEPADTLQTLETQLEAKLGLAADALGFELGDVIAGGEKELIIRLAYSKSDSINKPLNLGLDGDGLGLVSASNEGDIDFGYEVGMQFDVLIPLKANSALSDTRVLETSGATVSGNLNLDPLTFTAAIGPIEVGASGVAKLDIAVTLENPSTSPLSTADWLSGVDVALTGESQGCGSVDSNDLTGQACARLDLDVGGPVGTLGFRAEDITAPDDVSTYAGWFVYLPADLLTAIADNLLDFSLLFKALPEMATRLQGLLEQGAEDVKVPGLGDALDAGADVVGAINTNVISPLADIADAVTGVTAGEVETQIENKILALGAIVLDRTNDGNVDAADVDVVARCGGSDCADGASVDSIDDVQVTFLIGENESTSPGFDIGIDGLPISLSGATTAQVGWSLLIDVGLSKDVGPYYVAGGSSDPELQLTASVALGNKPGGCGADPTSADFFPQPEFAGFSKDRCLEGKLAFLSVAMFDDDGDPTSIELETTLDLTSSAPGGRLSAGDIINAVGFEPKIVAAANIDLALRTGIDATDGLPAVVGAFHLGWSFGTNNPSLGAPDVSFDHLYFDAGTFASGLLGPIVKEVRSVTSPLEPIVDFIRAEVPVLTQLAELVGEDPVTLLTLVEAAGGDVDLINTILDLISLANNLPIDAGAGNAFIALGSNGTAGSFALLGDKLLQGATTPDQAQTLIAPGANAGTNLADQLPGNVMSIASGDPGTFGVKGLTFPFLDDATKIFGLLMGQDVTIVRMDFGTFKASVSEGYEFGPIFLGPFPVTAEIGLAFIGEARFAMGYDTRGLRLVIAGGSATKLFDGIFIDDLDASGKDVDEWKLTFRVSAEAALDVLIAEAGVYGGVDSIISGNLDDRPNPDGKLYIEEIVDKLSNPICLFVIRGALEFFLGFYVEVDLFLWSDRWEWEIIRTTLLDFTLGCEGENPNLGDVVDGTLYLNIGSRANLRGIQESEKDEDFVVRQIGDGKVSVEAFGLKQERSGVTKVVAQDAADGDDSIALIRGGDDDNPIYFTIPSELNGGSGNDSLSGGDAIDHLNGGPGADKLIGGKGNDVIDGGGDDDRIDGGIGDDEVSGGGGNDTVMGGPGTDIINGDDGDDSLFGGPWTDANPDGGDTITGGTGNDNIDGGDGNDTLYGDESGLGCLDDGVAPGGMDSIRGGAGNDTLYGGNNDDNLIGNEANDKLCGNGGADILDGDDDDSSTPDASDRDESGGGGFAGGLFGGSGDDDMFGRGGDDEMFGGADDDDMFGGTGNDSMHGDDNDDHMYGEAGADAMNGNAGNDTMYGGDDIDTMHGNENNDNMFGDDGADLMYGDDGNDVMRGGTDNDTMEGNDGDDEMFGDSGEDRMFGGRNNDTMRGNQGDDYMEGNADDDIMYGDAGQDDMIGGSASAGAFDGKDTMHGNAGQDCMLGDNGTISRPGGASSADGTTNRVVTRFDLDCAAGVGDADTMNGDAANDDMYGGCGGDTMYGDAGDDFMEGNHGGDTMYGGDGQDDMVGGTGRVVSDDDATAVDGRQDGGDTMYGGNGTGSLQADFDVLVGDNAVVSRPLGPGGLWIVNTFNDAIVRNIRFLDLAEVGAPPVTPGSSGGDTMHGEANDDLMYGQGGNDNMFGGAGEDYMEGNAGDDTMEGNNGNDDMVGGTGRINDDGPDGVDGRHDGSDTMYGNAGFDVMAGDNALLVRTLVNGQWQKNTFNEGIQHEPRLLLDIDSPDSAVVSAGDVMFGGTDDDLMYGQGGSDQMHGNEGDDFMEGNADGDVMNGNEDDDDMIGGTVEPLLGDGGDTMHGNEEHDVMLGDNGTIIRPVDDDGFWIVDPNYNGVIRDITLFDVERAGEPPVPESSHGSDSMYGDAGRDIMFGQGNTDTDDDLDGRFDEDPADGRDNDRDGREGESSTVFDCEDGVDNDEDGLVDAADPDCAAAIDEDGGGDEMHGGDGVDYMEGNHGSDFMFGDGGEDDMLGGSSSGDGVFGSGVPPTNLLDGHDVMAGGDEDDAMLGDNGVIFRPVDESGLWTRITGGVFDLARRDEVMSPVPEVEGAFGHDFMTGNNDHDDMYGQQGDDYMEGNNGEDAMVGDLGRIVNTVEDGSREELISIPAPFLEDVIYEEGTLFRFVELFSYQTGDGAEGRDIMLGGDGRDSMHGCAGDDMMNGDGDSLDGTDPIAETDDEDHLFGGDDNDVMWGGRGHDHLWGGHGDDSLDVRPRTATRVTVPDSPEWFIYGEPDNYQGLDLIYGGWDQDAMQANIAEPGPPPADRLIDWIGGYNVYYVCPGAYGEGTITRMEMPGLREYMQMLSEADGALDPVTPGTSGFRELGFVFPNEAPDNSHRPHPDHPGHFVCDDGVVLFNRGEKTKSTREATRGTISTSETPTSDD